MWLDLVALGILAAFAALGAASGALRSGTALLALGVGYVVSILLAPVIGPPVAGALGTSTWLALPLGGTLAFFGGYAAVALLGALLRRLAERSRDARTARDRLLGAVFGAVRGSLIVLLVCWLALWLDALRENGGSVPVPPVGRSAAAAVTSRVVEAGMESALGPQPGSRVAARLAARPNVAIPQLESVLDSQSIAGLRADPQFWSDVESGNVDAALARTSFRLVSSDPDLRRELADLGLVGPEAAGDERAFRADVASVLEQVGPRIRGLRDDPEVHALVEDPQVVAMVQSGDTLGLLRHPGFRHLVERVTSRSAGQAAPKVP